MTDNPYQSPQTTSQATGVLSGSRDDLRNVARCQQGILVCISVYLLALVGRFLLSPELAPLVNIGAIFGGVGGAVCVFLFAIKTYGTGRAIVLGILSLVPLIGLIILLVVSEKVTNILKQNGIKVGLLGANVSSI